MSTTTAPTPAADLEERRAELIAERDELRREVERIAARRTEATAEFKHRSRQRGRAAGWSPRPSSARLAIEAERAEDFRRHEALLVELGQLEAATGAEANDLDRKIRALGPEIAEARRREADLAGATDDPAKLAPPVQAGFALVASLDEQARTLEQRRADALAAGDVDAATAIAHEAIRLPVELTVARRTLLTARHALVSAHVARSTSAEDEAQQAFDEAQAAFVAADLARGAAHERLRAAAATRERYRRELTDIERQARNT